MTPTVPRARLAISAQFFTNGALYASLVPRLPELKALYGLSDFAFGVMIVCMPIGALIAAPVSGRVIRRFGALRVATVGTVLLAILLTVAGFMPSALLFGIFLALSGMTDAVLDAAQNVQGLAVQRWRGRSVINSLHALWSLGAFTGGLIGAASAGAGIAIGPQLLAGAVVWAIVSVIVERIGVVPPEYAERQPSAAELQAAEDAAGTPRRRGIPAAAWRYLAPLVVLAICGALIEDTAMNWVSLFLQREVGLTAGLAGLGFALTFGAQFVGRIIGDPLTDRLGANRVAMLGGACAVLGLALAFAAPWAIAAVIGFALMGFGCATMVPAAFAGSDETPGLPHGTGVAIVSWLMRGGFLIAAPAFGAVSDATNLRVALSVPGAAALVALVVAGLLVRRGRAGADGAAPAAARDA